MQGFPARGYDPNFFWRDESFYEPSAKHYGCTTKVLEPCKAFPCHIRGGHRYSSQRKVARAAALGGSCRVCLKHSSAPASRIACYTAMKIFPRERSPTSTASSRVSWGLRN